MREVTLFWKWIGRTIRMLTMFATSMVMISSVASEAVAKEAARQVESVAPGVWRIRLGTPESHTPVR